MARRTSPLLIALTAALAGCASQGAKGPQRHAALNTALVERLHAGSVENAVIRQQSLFPYHFVAETAELNGLGRHDLGILADHYRSHGGVLRVARGNAPSALYDARLRAVREYLAASGVDADRLAISDAVPGGDGATAARVIEIMEQDRAARLKAAPVAGAGLSTTGGG